MKLFTLAMLALIFSFDVIFLYVLVVMSSRSYSDFCVILVCAIPPIHPIDSRSYLTFTPIIGQHLELE